MFYATLEADGYTISENASIAAFETLDAAREYLMAGADLDDEEVTWEIEAGQYSDTWVKTYDKPDAETPWLAPFKLDDVIVRAPGTHPGGKRYWVEPSPEVLVLIATFKSDA